MSLIDNKTIFDWRQIPLVLREELNQIAEKIKKQEDF
jgi:hypothetical protein